MKMPGNAIRAIMVGLATATLAIQTAPAQDVVKIGDVNSYKCQAAHLDFYKRGVDMAVDEVNTAGGVDSKKVFVITRDDNCNPGESVRAAEELASQEKVDVLTGSFLSSVALALSDFAKRRKIPFLSTMSFSDKQIWQNGNRYSFRLRPGTYTQTKMLVAEAVKLHKKQWALVYPNYEMGQLASATFKGMLRAVQPEVTFVAEQAPPLGKTNADYVVQALADANPEAIFNVLFGSDLITFARAGKTRGLFDGREVLGLVSGEPENLQPLGADAPEGWIVTGYSPEDVKIPEHAVFLKNYQARYKEDPGISAVMGYLMVKSVAAAIAKAQSTDRDKIAVAFHGLHVETPFGRITYRPEDNQSTLGTFVGLTKFENGKPSMVDSRYLDGADYQPTPAEVQAWRAPD